MTILKDTSLAAIVRDEINNPAGGISRWLDFTLPFVEQAVIVDTGSIDGTRQVLEEYSGKFPNLKVFDCQWKGFADARNFSLSKVKTKFAFVLDADEILAKWFGTTSEAYTCLANAMEFHGADAYDFQFGHIHFPNDQPLKCGAHNPRLFKNEKVEFKGNVGELLSCFYGRYSLKDSVYIAHFLPKSSAKIQKCSDWCGYQNFLCETPSENAKIYGWKEFNPRRGEFRLA